jgi:DNA-binding transcriptional regulator YbjK
LTERAIRGEARRELILDAAIRVLAVEGPSGLTHRRVAAEAGLPVAATTYWFTSKDDLLAQAYRRAADRDIARVQAVADAADPDDLGGALIALMRAELSEGQAGLLAAFTLWLESARRPELRGIEEEWTAAYTDALAVLLRRSGSPHPKLDAELLTATLDGLLLAHAARGEGGDPGATLAPQLRRLAAALTRH